MKKAEIEDKLDEGFIRVLVGLQVVGKPQAHVEKSIADYIELIKKEEALHVIDINDLGAEELDDQEGFFSALAEVELLCPGIDALTQIAFNLSPASIEIIEPQEYQFEGRQLQNWMNDMLAMLHSTVAQLRGERQRAGHLNSALFTLARNSVTIILTTGPKDLKVLKRMTGMEEGPLTKVLEKMEENNEITKDGDQWTLKSADK